MEIIPGLKQKHINKAEDQAKKLIAQFDANNDGVLSQEELKEKEVRRYTTTDGGVREWYNEDYIKYTHTDKVDYDRIDADKFKTYDADKDGKLTADEMVEAFMKESDRNKDGKVGFFERWLGRLPSIDQIFKRSRTQITGQRTTTVYSPKPRDNDRPTPPGGSTGGDRPTPPGGSTGGDRPTPPGGSTGGDRPTPPGGSSSGSDRPTPPGGSSSSGSDRPTPPGGR